MIETGCPVKFRGTMSVREFIATYKPNQVQVATLVELASKGKLWLGEGDGHVSSED